MKPAPAPNVPGSTEEQWMYHAIRKMFTVPKEAVLQKEARLLAASRRKRNAKAKRP